MMLRVPNEKQVSVMHSLNAVGWFLIILFLGVGATAFELRPEYRSLPSERGFELMNPKLIDSEYQSDLLTYSASPWMPGQPRGGIGRIYVSAGSLSATQFDYHLLGEVRKSLSPGTHVSFLRIEEQNYEEAFNTSMLELEWGTSPFSLSVYGSLSRMKRDDDVGLALAMRGERETRFFVTLADFTRSDRNDDGDYFDKGGEAVVYGVVSRRQLGAVGSEWYIRREAPVSWRSPSLRQQYLYEQTAVGFTRTQADSSLRGFFDRKETSIRDLNSDQLRSILRDRIELEMRSIDSDGAVVVESGLLWVARLWHDENSRHLIHQNLSPFLWLRFHSGIELGWETTFFRAFGDLSLASPSLRAEADESRVNLRYRHRFVENGELILALTADADQAEGGVFEGGHGQFVVDF